MAVSTGLVAVMDFDTLFGVLQGLAGFPWLRFSFGKLRS